MLGVASGKPLKFPSPQGGSETLHRPPFEIGMKCFHPLKAGRRQIGVEVRFVNENKFPSPQGGSETCAIIAGGRPAAQVSIPSRRVGDSFGFGVVLGVVRFPSPQGGSETVGGWELSLKPPLFPSPQGGSETC